jgi:hypothetical protein
MPPDFACKTRICPLFRRNSLSYICLTCRMHRRVLKFLTLGLSLLIFPRFRIVAFVALNEGHHEGAR